MSEQKVDEAPRIGGQRNNQLRSMLAPVSALLLSVSILLMGNGLQGMLVPVRANLESFTAISLGLLGTAYFLGFTLGCVHGPLLLRRAGHIRTFLAMTSVASVVSLLHAIWVDPIAWWALRAFSGYCFAVLYIVIESWLNAQSGNTTRGKIFSVYTVINLTVVTAGQMMLALSDPASFSLFAVASILVSLAALPIAFTIAASPTPAAFALPRLRRLYGISPVGVGGCFAVGLANGAFWTLGPVYAQNEGFNLTEIAVFMSVVVLGGAVSQWPIGSLSDRMDRRIVLIAATVCAVVAAMAIMVIPGDAKLAIIAAGALFGAGAFPLYALAVAHANDYADASECVEVSSGLLLIYGLGAAAGPLLASLWRVVATGPTLFYFTAVVHAALIVYVVWRTSQRVAVPAEERAVFSDVAIAAQTVMPFDPIGRIDAPGPADEASDEEAAEAEAGRS